MAKIWSIFHRLEIAVILTVDLVCRVLAVVCGVNVDGLYKLGTKESFVQSNIIVMNFWSSTLVLIYEMYFLTRYLYDLPPRYYQVVNVASEPTLVSELLFLQ